MRVLTLCAVVLLSANLFGGDVTLRSKNFDKNKNEAGQTNFYFKPDRLLIENKSENDNNSLIFEVNKKQFTFIDHGKKEYYQATEAELRSFVTQIRQMLVMTKAFLKNMPAEQQEAIQKSLGKFLNAGDQPETKFSKTSSGVKVSGWPTDKYDATQNGNKISEMFIASHSELGVSKDDFKSFEIMSDIFGETIQEFAGILPMGPSVQGMASNLDDNPAFKDGIPVKSLTYVNGQLDGENQIVEVLNQEIPSGKFEMPSGYTKKNLEMPKMGM